MQAKHLTPADVVNAISVQNLILPGGTQKLGTTEYDVDMNASPKTIEELNDLPIRTVAGNTIYIHDVAHVRDGFPPQTNIVRVDGSRAALLTIQKVGNASTLDIINNVKKALPRIAASLPPELEIKPLADQSVFVQASISGVLREALIAACLTALMILVFLGSWRSTVIIAVSIPLSILSSIIVLSALGETINIMTLGGLALAVGILVDDATVAIENINWHLEQGKDLEPAILEGADQIAIPAFVSTICICIVFVPMFFLTGVARYLFVPMAEAVVFAMLASYVLSRTLVPTMAMYLLQRARRARRGRAVEKPAGAGCSARSTAASCGCATATARCSSGASAAAPSSPRCSWAPASRRCSWRDGSARISSRRSTAASSSCTCARRAARGSRRRRFSATTSRTRCASSSRPASSPASSTTSACPTRA